MIYKKSKLLIIDGWMCEMTICYVGEVVIYFRINIVQESGELDE